MSKLVNEYVKYCPSCIYRTKEILYDYCPFGGNKLRSYCG